VFFTWHAGQRPEFDRGFGKPVSWDIPLTTGYEYEAVPNISRDPGTHHFRGLQNPDLMPRLLAWKPDVVHLTGYPYASHLHVIRQCHAKGLPLLFRGDSHLLDREPLWKRVVKRVVLGSVFKMPAAFLYVGHANKAYYRRMGVSARKLYYCPHSIDVDRFSKEHERFEAGAKIWRQQLGITADKQVLLFAGKFERKKRPIELMERCLNLDLPDLVVIMAGDGELGSEVRRRAASSPDLFRVLPFQNQSHMPIVYRLGDAFTLPSAYGETWGLAVNEALACGRPVLVSDRVGCARDAVQEKINGEVFASDSWDHFRLKLTNVFQLRSTSSWEISKSARRFDVSATEETLMRALGSTLNLQFACT
jgi:glycosyltransferase involved in cell wall biosynthesis